MQAHTSSELEARRVVKGGEEGGVVSRPYTIAKRVPYSYMNLCNAVVDCKEIQKRALLTAWQR